MVDARMLCYPGAFKAHRMRALAALNLACHWPQVRRGTRGGKACSGQLSGAKGGAREHLRVKRKDAVGPRVHLAALHPHKQAPSAGREGEAGQRAGLPRQRSYRSVHINDLHPCQPASRPHLVRRARSSHCKDTLLIAVVTSAIEQSRDWDACGRNGMHWGLGQVRRQLPGPALVGSSWRPQRV